MAICLRHLLLVSSFFIIFEPKYTFSKGILLKEPESLVYKYTANRYSPLHNTHEVHIVKRDVQKDQICLKQKNTFETKIDTPGFENKANLGNDSGQNLALAWSSKNKIVAVTTEEGFLTSKPSFVYFSGDGGHNFESRDDIKSDSGQAQIHSTNGLLKHPKAENKVYLVAYDDASSVHSILYTSVDGGETFQKIKLKFQFFGNIIFHHEPAYSNHLLILDSDEKLWYSNDNGQSWKNIKEDVISAKWAETTNSVDTVETIYCAVRVESDVFDLASFFGLKTESQDNDLEKSDDFGSSWNIIHKHVYSFGIQGKFIYVSVFLSADDEKKDKRIMEVSIDGGKSWQEVQLPAIEQDRFFSILEMTGDMVFIHVDEPGNSGFGTLYVSDSTGVIYTESLRNHLYPNFLDLTDFYPVKSMRGVYIASQMEEDKSIHTMISYDRGGEWIPISRPKGMPCKDENKACYLQIHNLYSMHSHVVANPPLSVPSAKGLILVHGHVAAALQTTPPDVFITTDGGYNWRKTLDGPHHYQIADQGGFIVAVPYEDFPKVIKFSTDEGNCWHEHKFTDEDIYFTGLLTAPDNKDMSVAIWGYRKDDRVWKIHTFDFEKIISKNCTDNDYETWTPHFANEKEGCFLGLKEEFYKIKKDSWCHNNRDLEVASSNKVNCPCTKADYDCDYGYHRIGNSEKCVLNEMFKGPKIDICMRGHAEQIVFLGYHKIPGDVCEQTDHSFSAESLQKKINLHRVCIEGDRSILDENIKPEYIANASEDSSKKVSLRANTVVLISLLTIILLLGIIIVAYITRKTIFKSSKLSYRYSQLNTNDYDRDVTAALTTHTSLYEDESEEESRPISSRDTNIRVPSALQNGVLPKWEMASAATTNTNKSSQKTLQKINKAGAASSSDNATKGDAAPIDVQFQANSPIKSYHDDSDVDLLE